MGEAFLEGICLERGTVLSRGRTALPLLLGLGRRKLPAKRCVKIELYAFRGRVLFVNPLYLEGETEEGVVTRDLPSPPLGRPTLLDSRITNLAPVATKLLICWYCETGIA